MSSVIVSKEQARDFLLSYHGMIGKRQFYGKDGIVEYIKKVGCIQFDPLNVVGRNVDLVLQSKVRDYKPDMLEDLLYDHRELIDGWDKMMSIYHMSDFQNMTHVRKAHSEENINIMQHRGTIDALNYLDTVKEIIVQEGPKFSREIKLGGIAKGRWSSNKLSNVALDHLYNLGVLGIVKKKGTQKQYDLLTNLIAIEDHRPQNCLTCDHDFYKWYLKRRINSVGLLWNKNGGAWLGHFISNKRLRTKLLAELVDDGEIVPVTIQGIAETVYIDAKNIDDLQRTLSYQKEVRFLAPLDNLMWDREFIKKLFNFDYSWEVYIPKEKRKYGYYVLPVLYGNEIIARFEPVKCGTSDELSISNWWWESHVEIHEILVDQILKAFEDFSSYLGKALNKDDIRAIIKGPDYETDILHAK